MPALLIVSLSLQYRLLLLLLQLALLQLPGPVTGFDLHGKLWVHFLLQRGGQNKCKGNVNTVSAHVQAPMVHEGNLNESKKNKQSSNTSAG